MGRVGWYKVVLWLAQPVVPFRAVGSMKARLGVHRATALIRIRSLIELSFGYDVMRAGGGRAGAD